MKKFTPIKKETVKSKLTEILLEGKIIRYDFREEMPLEVLDREKIKSLHNMRNIGQEEQSVVNKITCSHNALSEVVAQLSKEYSIRRIHCSHSGCLQYTTYGVYIDG